MTVYVYDHELNKVVEKGQRSCKCCKDREYQASTMIIPDVQPFISPIDRSVVGSRSQIREHEKVHNVRQVGNDFNGLKSKDYRQNSHLH